MPTRWLIVGSGRCGLQLARALVAARTPLTGVVVRSARGRARVHRLLPGIPAIAAGAPIPAAEGLLIAVPDSAVASCASELAARLPLPSPVALHTSGLLPGAALAPLRKHGTSVGSFHPLLSFPAAGGPPVRLDGACAAIEGEPLAVRTAFRLARSLGMNGQRIAPADKPAYHAAAVIAANLTHVLVAEARRLLEDAGFTRTTAARALAPLVGGSVAAALAARGLERLTGPLARGDAATISAHLAAVDAPLAAAYRALGRLAVARLVAAGGPQTSPKSGLDSVLRALTDT